MAEPKPQTPADEERARQRAERRERRRREREEREKESPAERRRRQESKRRERDARDARMAAVRDKLGREGVQGMVADLLPRWFAVVGLMVVAQLAIPLALARLYRRRVAAISGTAGRPKPPPVKTTDLRPSPVALASQRRCAVYLGVLGLITLIGLIWRGGDVSGTATRVLTFGGIIAWVTLRDRAMLGYGAFMVAQISLQFVGAAGMTIAMGDYSFVGFLPSLFHLGKFLLGLYVLTIVLLAVWPLAARLLRLSPEMMVALTCFGFAGMGLGMIATILGSAVIVAVGLLRFVPRQPGPPVRLLMLRTFGSGHETGRLLGTVARQWTPIGPIRLLASADLGGVLMQPHLLLGLLTFQLKRMFISTTSDRQRAIARLQGDRYLDGTYPVQELRCLDSTWFGVFSDLLAQSDAVIFDIRGYSAKNEGCAREIVTLVTARVPVGVVLIHDQSTDLDHLNTVIARANPALSTRDLNPMPVSSTAADVVRAAVGSARSIGRARP